MTDHEPLPVKGYTAQPDWKVELVNKNKSIEEIVLRHLDAMESLGEASDRRWLSIARTHIEQGFMAANRAILKPQRINL